MIPDSAPAVLRELTTVELLLIARVTTCMVLIHLPGGQRGCTGNSICFEADIGGLASTLPRTPDSLQLVVVRVHRSAAEYTDLRVRRQRVLAALTWLIAHNRFYSDVQLDADALRALPADGPVELPEVASTDLLDELLRQHAGPADPPPPPPPAAQAASGCGAARDRACPTRPTSASSGPSEFASCT